MSANPFPPRLQREQQTFLAMQRIYCRAKHADTAVDTENGLCPECRKLAEYARVRLQNCPFQEQKPACTKCLIHCYNKDMRLRVKEMMRFSGPRMIFRHPLLALLHLADGFRKPANLPK